MGYQMNHRQPGVAGRPDMRVLSVVPPEAVVENAMCVRMPGERTLNLAQAVQIGLTWRLCSVEGSPGPVVEETGQSG